MLNNPQVNAFAKIKDVGVGIRFATGQQVHIGLLYHLDDKAISFLHLPRHLELKNEAPSDGYLWVQVELEEMTRRLVAGMCALIALKNKNIPFGFTYGDLYFDPAGNYIFHPPGYGLTCATFVMAVFDRLDVPLIKTGEWPTRPMDRIWQAQRVAEIKHQRGALGDLIASGMADHIGKPRFKPEEVTAGAVSKSKPLGFKEAAKLGGQILADLEKARAKQKKKAKKK